VASSGRQIAIASPSRRGRRQVRERNRDLDMASRYEAISQGPVAKHG
jgi:hypothetical protein